MTPERWAQIRQIFDGALERLRATFRWKADGLTATQLQTRVGASTLTIGGLQRMFGLGAQYKLNKQVSFSLEWEHYGKNRDNAPKLGSVVTLGARYNF